jgi:sugar phosphate isomerase/epimerase
MKLSVAIARADAPPSAFVVWRGFEPSIAKAADLGYHGVELALASADDVDRRTLETCLSRYAMSVSCISTGQVAAVLGLAFTDPDPQVRERVAVVFEGIIALAADLDCIVSVGRARGAVMDSMAPSRFVDTARRLCDRAGERGVTIALEPVNRYETNFINRLDEGADVIAQVGRTNLRLMPDTFHMNIEEAKIGEALARHAGLIEYVHLADSNRRAPGQGHVDFADVFAGLSAARFDGWAAIEILPEPDADTAARQAAHAVLPRIAEAAHAG